MQSRRWTAARIWQAYLVVFLVPLACYYLLAPFTQRVVYDVLGASAGIAVLVGIRLYRPSRPGPWLLLAAAQFMWVAGDVTWDVLTYGLDTNPFPSAADILYLAGYPLAAAGLVLLVARRRRKVDWRELADAAIVTIALCLVGWVILVDPVIADPTLTPLERVVSLAYPLGDVLLLAVLVPVIATPGRLSTAIWLLVASITAAVLADSLFAVAGTGQIPQLTSDAVFLVGYALWGAAALHPSMADPLGSARTAPTRLTVPRLAGFVVALLIPAAIVAIDLALGSAVDSAAVAIGFALIAVLVFVRIAGLAGELTRSEELYRTLVDRSADAIFLLAGDPPVVREANAAASDLLDRDRAELIGTPVAALVPSDELAGQRDRIAALRRSGAPLRVELRMRRADGTDVETELSEQATRDGRIIAVARDVGERKRAEAERARLAAAVEQTADTVVISDLDGRVVYVNPAFERTTGYTRMEMAGKPPEEIEPIFGTSPAAPEVWAALRDGRSWAGTVANRRTDGAIVEMDIVISAVHDESGAPIGTVGVGRDVTDQRTLEAQLRQAQKMEAVGQLAGGMAHDFNNLLTAIRGYTSMILDSLPPDDRAIRADLDQIVLASDRAAQLTRQMLAFSRRQALQPRVIDPADVVAGIAPMLRTILGEQVEIVIHGSPGLGCVRADPGGLEQVVVNLAVNAGDAMPAGGVVTIEVAVVEIDADASGHRVQLAPGAYVRLSVTDTGAGMDGATMARAFDPFFTTKQPGKGTGMGLAMVYGFVTQSGGSVDLESAPGRGTSVRVYLPRVAGEPATVARLAPAGPSATAEGGPPGSGIATILLTEDEPPVRGFVRRTLESRGYRVLEAASGPDALAIAADETMPIDLLVTDVVMPSMGGRELAERLAAARPHLRVLYISGFTERGPRGPGLPGEGVRFLPKPFSGDALATAVREALEVPDPST